MPTSIALLIDILIALACVEVVVFLMLTYKLTRAWGLGFFALGFLWSVVVRISVVAHVQFFMDYGLEMVLPSFLCYVIGAPALYYSVRKLYEVNGYGKNKEGE